MPERKSLLGTAGKAAAGLAAAAAAAYGVYLVGSSKGRRRPVTELRNPLGIRLHYAQWRGVHYAYYRRRGTGAPLVLLHGVNAASAAHEILPLARGLTEGSDRPVLALEWIGFGHSDRPDVDYTPELFEDQLEHFLERVVNQPADVVGFSLGGNYAVSLARRRPDLVRTITAVEPTLGTEPAEIGKGWGRLLFTLPGVQQAFHERLTRAEALAKFARQHLFSPGFAVPDEFIDYGVEASRAEGAFRPLDDYMSGRLHPPRALEQLLHLRQPLLLVHGTVDDRRLEAFSVPEELASRPTVQTLAVPAGALPHWERPAEVVGRILEFLEMADALHDAPATLEGRS
jgi:pimeloyl-ACP methyl ester carboxylesterase